MRKKKGIKNDPMNANKCCMLVDRGARRNVYDANNKEAILLGDFLFLYL